MVEFRKTEGRFGTSSSTRRHKVAAPSATRRTLHLQWLPHARVAPANTTVLAFLVKASVLQVELGVKFFPEPPRSRPEF